MQEDPPAQEAPAPIDSIMFGVSRFTFTDPGLGEIRGGSLRPMDFLQPHDQPNHEAPSSAPCSGTPWVTLTR